MPIPTNKKLYEEVKAEIYKNILRIQRIVRDYQFKTTKEEVEHMKERKNKLRG